MNSIRLLFSTAANPFSALIRAATWSRWSHVALVDGLCVIEATVVHGVRRISLMAAINQSQEFVLATLPCVNSAGVIAAAANQIGKPYDYTAILGMGLHRDWQEDDSWFCSELVAWGFSAAGQPLFRGECMRRITPQHLWMLAPAVLNM